MLQNNGAKDEMASVQLTKIFTHVPMSPSRAASAADSATPAAKRAAIGDVTPLSVATTIKARLSSHLQSTAIAT